MRKTMPLPDVWQIAIASVIGGAVWLLTTKAAGKVAAAVSTATEELSAYSIDPAYQWQLHQLDQAQEGLNDARQLLREKIKAAEERGETVPEAMYKRAGLGVPLRFIQNQ